MSDSTKEKKNIFAKHYSREGDSGYFNTSQVKQKIDKYSNLLQQIDIKDSALLQEILTNLENLLNILKKQEDNFYNRFHIGEKEHTEFYHRITEWRNTMGHLLSKNTAIKVCNIMSRIISDDDVANALEHYLNHPKEPLVDIELLSDNLAAFINNNLNIDSEGKNKKKGNLSISKNIGINSKFQVISGINGSYEVRKIDGDDKEISDQLKLKIVRIVNRGLEDNDKISTKVTNEIQEQIYDILSENVTNTLMLMCLRDELIRRNDEYTKFPNQLVIQGWLGEIYWNAAFSYITQTRYATIPTGAIKNTKGQQLSVDIVYKDAGFQVKNWSINKEGQHSTIKKMNFGNFLKNKVELLNSSVGEIIAQAFGATSYNKPNKDYSGEEHYKDYEEVYKSLTNLTQQLDPLNNLFYSYLNKIIGIDTSNKMKTLLPTGGILYYNTFWLINDKIIPSSVIIRQLIDDVRNAFKSMLGNSGVSFRIIDMKDAHEEGKNNSVLWPEETNFTDLAMANRWSITYEYTFDLNSLLEKAVYKI